MLPAASQSADASPLGTKLRCGRGCSVLLRRSGAKFPAPKDLDGGTSNWWCQRYRMHISWSLFTGRYSRLEDSSENLLAAETIKFRVRDRLRAKLRPLVGEEP